MITYTIYVEGKLEKQNSYSQRKAGDSVHTAFWALMSLVNVMTTSQYRYRFGNPGTHLSFQH